MGRGRQSLESYSSKPRTWGHQNLRRRQDPRSESVWAMAIGYLNSAADLWNCVGASSWELSLRHRITAAPENKVWSQPVLSLPLTHLLLLPQPSGWRCGATSLPVAGDTQVHLPRAALLGVVRVPVIVHLGGK